jgi:hypothetical protein
MQNKLFMEFKLTRLNVSLFNIRKLYYPLHYFLLVLLTTIGYNSYGQQAQAGMYSFTQTSGTYTPITGGTLLKDTIPDSWTSPPIKLIPSFIFCGVAYDTAYITSNGFLTFKNPAPSSTHTTAVSTNTGSGIALSVFSTNLRNSTMAGAASQMRYQLVGDEHVFQWKDACRTSLQASERISFQIRLNHVTGTIKYVYDVPNVGSSTSNFPEIGIRTAATAGNWQSRTVGTGAETWATTLASSAITDKMRITSGTSPKSPSTGQTYIFTPPPPCSNPGIVFPTTAATAVTASPNSICVSGNVTLNFSTTTPLPIVTGITYKWQTAPTATGTWVDIPGAVTSLPTYTTTTPVTVSAYFRCLVMCNGTAVAVESSASNLVTVSNPGLAIAVPGSRCGPGSVALAATAPAGTTLRWYETATGGNPLNQGPTYSTPYLTTSRNYFVSAGSLPVPLNMSVGAGALTPSFDYVTIFAGGWGGYKHQFLIREDELIALGITPGANIYSISVDNKNGTSTYNGFSMSLKSANVNVLTTTFETGSVPVYGPINHTTTLGINTFTLTTPYTWTGGSLIIETCWSNATTSNTYSNLAYDNTNFGATHHAQLDNSTPTTVCNIATAGTVLNRRPKFILNIDASCQGARTPVMATINASTPVPKTLPAVICNDAVGTIALTNPNPAYSSYNWSSSLGGDLYNDAAGTSPYTTGSSLNMYVKSTTPGIHTIYMMAGNPTLTTGCTYADTFNIHVQPGSIAINAAPDTICISGASTLKLNPINPYYTGTIQWFRSTDNASYNIITGANSTSYTTPTLSYGDNTYYRAQIKAGSTVCENPTKYIVVVNPQLVTSSDSFNCGPGSVVLTASTAGNSSPIWYDSPSGGSPIGTGSPWTTPYLSQTTNYYVAAHGSGAEGIGIVGAGASTSSGTNNPFYHSWGGSKNQYLITEAQLVAAGINPGTNLVSLGLDVTSIGTGAFQNFTISIKSSTLTAMATPFQTGFVQVKAPATANLVTGINTFMFTTPYYWEGGNIIIQTCYSNNNTGGTSATVRGDSYSVNYNLNGYGDSQTYASLCGTNPNNGPFTSTFRPKILLGHNNKCESPRQLVKASIYPKPVVDLGPDIEKCIDEGEGVVLDAGLQPNTPQYLWDNGSTGRLRSAFVTGDYFVKVTNEFNCSTSDSVKVLLKANPIVDLGNDTTICEDLELRLDAGNDGISYYWNTGATTSSIIVRASGSYNVFVTNDLGCTKVDTIQVNVSGLAPTIDGINITNNGVNSFHFTAVNPQNIIGYDWDFGDNTPHSFEVSPIHVYAQPGNYMVKLTISSTCGFVIDSSSAHILPTSINDIDSDKQTFMVYPNPTSEIATIWNKGSLKMQHITVYNILGQKIISEPAQSVDKHQLSLSNVTSGVYTIQISTEKGNITRKLELIK